MHLGGADYKLLEIFVAVVDAQGISNAQSLLGKDTSTISRSIALLEARLGIRLCDRGRQGFSLTSEGFEVYQSSLTLLATFRRMEDEIESIKGVSDGKLKIAMIDNITSDPNCPLTRALSQFAESGSNASSVQTSITVLSPDRMEKQLEERRIDLAIGIFEIHKSSLKYQKLYQEVDYLYCASRNPIAKLASETDVRRVLNSERFVTRKFLEDSELRLLGIQRRDDFVYTENIEAVTQLVLANLYIGFIPHHFAAPWVKQGQLRPIMPHKFFRHSDIEAAYLDDPASLRPVLASVLNSLSEDSINQSYVQLSQA